MVGTKPSVHVVGSWVVMRTSDVQQINKLKNNFSYTHIDYDYLNATRCPRQIDCYKIGNNGSGLYTLTIRRGFLPRLVACLKRNGIEYDYFPDGEEDDVFTIDVDYLESMVLRPEQIDCLEAILSSQGGVIDAPTGFGKSFLFPILVKLYKTAKIDIVTKRKDVAIQIYRNLLDNNIPAGLVTSGIKRSKNRVTVYTSGSLGHSDYSANIVLLDECHELVTAAPLQYLLKYNKAIMFGFTASSNTRYDNAWFRLEELCGPIIYRLDYMKLQQRGSVVPIIIQWIPVYRGFVCSGTANLMFRRRFGVWRNEYRNRLIAETARKYHDDGNQVLIITKTLEHALYLKQHLPDFVICCSGVNDRQREKFSRAGLPVEEAVIAAKDRIGLAEKFRARQIMGAIATEVWTTGVSFDDLEVLIRADADISKTAAIQVPGRVCRLGKKVKKEAGLVVNFADCFDPVLYRRSVALYKFYKKMGWTQCDAELQSVSNFPYSQMRIK